MDSRDIPPQPPLSHNQLQQSPEMLMNHYRNPNAVSLMGPTSTSQSIHHRSLTPQSQTLHQQQQQQQQQQMDQKTLESLGFGDGSSPSSQPMRFGIDQNSNQSQNQQQQVKKKRGRPRKYTPDGGIALGLAPTSPLLSNSYGGGVGDNSGGNVNSADPPAKRNRGRPPGSSKKQLDALGAA